MKYVFSFLWGLALSPCFAATPAAPEPVKELPSWWSRGWGATIYSGPITSQTTTNIPSNPDFEGYSILVEAISKEILWFYNDRLDFELETQLVEHFGGQTHLEINPIVLIARWNSFPWNDTVRTTAAIGDGLSIATRIPEYEWTRRGPNEVSRVLNYVMAEITLSLPDVPEWALVARYHHRSGTFGLFNGVHDASTAFAAGLKYWF